jgi:hypothetical protein
MSEFVVSGDELKKLQEDASVSSAIKELAGLLGGRVNDLPHRFRAPSSLRDYFNKYPVNQSYYHQIPIMYANAACPLILQITTRPAQNILELIFQGADGMRLFTLEIEYA